MSLHDLRRTPMRPLLLGLAPLALVLAMPAAAFAHGIAGRATNLTTVGYIPLGVEHMLLGWDHLLFVLGIVLLAGNGQRAAKLISLFVLGHSLTLITGTIYEWRLSPALVDAVIALSVVFVAGIGIHGRPKDWTIPAIVIFLFGLVHGLGLSTRLQDLGIPDAGLIGKTIAFNVGIEIGQLLAVLVMVLLIMLLKELAPTPRWPLIRRVLFGAIAVVGAAGAVWLLVGVGDDDTTIAASSSSGQHVSTRLLGCEREAVARPCDLS